jgi:hypothetical protein
MTLPAMRVLFVLVLLGLCRDTSRAQQTRLLGFTDINYVETERDIPSGFEEGQLAGHLATSLSEHLLFFGEVSLTARSTGFFVTVERTILRYEFADFFKLSAGRYHTPISYWNTAFHHGLWLQTSVARPEMIKFGSRFLPVHFVGLLAEGTLPKTKIGLGYVAGFGNGRAENLVGAGDAGDANDHRAWLLGLTVRPVTLFGLHAGTSFYRDRIDTEAGVPVDESIYSAFLAWEREHPEFIAEYSHVVHDPETGGSSASNSYYIQLAYRLPEPVQRLKPYLRRERLDAPASDPIFGPLQLDYDGWILGLRFDFAALAALKAEYRNEAFEGSERFHSVYIQASFTFPGLALEQ